jgi:hypothetical protein
MEDDFIMNTGPCRAMQMTLAMTLAFGALGTPRAAAGDEMYDFELLNPFYFIHGQDNWVDQPSQGQAVIRVDETTENGSQVVRHHPTVNFNESAFITRVNDSSFGFEPFTGLESAAVLQFECTGDHIAMFALGHDRNGDGMVRSADGEIGPAFGTNDRQFAIQQANHGSTFAIDFGPGNSRDDWYRIRLRIDFTANDGDGSGSLLYLNVTDGDDEFLPVAGLESINLDLSAMHPDAGPARWDAMWLHLLTGGGNVPAADHLVPHVKTGPEGDINGDGLVNTEDLLSLLGAWGACPDPPEHCPADLDGDNQVNAGDLLILLANWT